MIKLFAPLEHVDLLISEQSSSVGDLVLNIRLGGGKRQTELVDPLVEKQRNWILYRLKIEEMEGYGIVDISNDEIAVIFVIEALVVDLVATQTQTSTLG